MLEGKEKGMTDKEIIKEELKRRMFEDYGGDEEKDIVAQGTCAGLMWFIDSMPKTPKKRLRVLVACEESQTVCKAFRELGHEAYSCDIEDCSGGHPEWHLKQDVLPLLKIEWDLIIAHPPCTYMSKAGARWMYPKAGELSQERFRKSQEAKEFFLKFYNLDCKHVAIENPVPLKVVGLPKPTQKIQPYEFGEPYSKATLLWLKGLPKLVATNILDNYVPWMPSNTGGFSRGQGGSRGIAHDQRTASKTFDGIAKAMAEQWSNYILEVEK